MAIDSAAKRSSVAGVGRPWMRAQTNDATKAAPWRAAVGLAYAGLTFAVAADPWTELSAPATTWGEENAPATTWGESSAPSTSWTESSAP